jgi:ribonuclease P protein component
MFKKEHRLAKTKDVKAAFEQGRGFFNPYFSVRRAFEKTERKRFTVVVSTKVSKTATTRNRIKRLVREFIRLNMDSLKPGDYIISAKPKVMGLETDAMLGFLKKLLI